MTKKNYQPQLNSIAHQVCRYFQRLEDEELSIADIALKWNIDSGNVHNLLGRAVDAGLLKRDGKIYSAGPQLHTLQAEPADALASGALLGRKPAQRAPGRLQVTQEDLDALPVEEGVNPTHMGTPKGTSKWNGLFAKLQRPGQSVPIPLIWKKPVATESTKRNREARAKGQQQSLWRVGNCPQSPQHARLWRLN